MPTSSLPSLSSTSRLSSEACRRPRTARHWGARGVLISLTIALAACATSPASLSPVAQGGAQARTQVEKALTNCAVAAMAHLNIDQADIGYRVGSSAELTLEPAALRERVARCAAELDVHAAPSVSGRIEIRSTQQGHRQ